MNTSPHPMSDAGLWQTLKHYDPVAQPSQRSLAELEANILARIDQPPQEVPVSGMRIPTWLQRQSWTTRVTFIASASIVILGFVAGQMTYLRDSPQQLAMSPSLLVLANETALLPAPLTTVGDSDEDDE